MRLLESISVGIAVAALLAPAAHVFEMFSKFQLDGPLWLAVQQNLYRGWGPFIGAPTEIGGLVVNGLLFLRQPAGARRPWGVAACSYLGMIIVFFVFNSPVNAAVSAWTTATLPSDWKNYRLQWELGHGIAAILALVALLSVIKASNASAKRERIAEGART